MTLITDKWLQEDHLTSSQESLEEMMSFYQTPLLNSKICGGLISDVKMLLNNSDKDLLPNQASTLMRHSTAWI